ncbi:claspin [Anopheles nili]|uniref:claspin n=1 Tax=Anopheles nili TaxID=185578 RepID=UPI00237ABEFF|nr:claspin [Anopheles nili]
MDYDSDSELRLTDTLRIDSDSEDDIPAKNKDIVSEENYIAEHELTTNNEAQKGKDLVHNDNKSESQNDTNIAISPKFVRKTKLSNIIDSDSEDEQISLPQKAQLESDPVAYATTVNRLKNLLDSDSDSSSEDQHARKNQKSKKITKKKSKKESVVLDKVTESDNKKYNKNEPAVQQKSNRKHKNASKNVKPPPMEIKSAREILASLNLFFDDDEEKSNSPLKIKADKAAYSSSDDECNEAYPRRRIRNGKIPLTSKQATKDKQVIQSESQRMAREMYIDVPYHRTKAFSFKQFHARKTICKPDPKRDCVGKSASMSMSIKMNREELEVFERQLKERELESQIFFKSESESEVSESEPSKKDADTKQCEPMDESMPFCKEPVSQSIDESENVASEPSKDFSSSGEIPLGTDPSNTPSNVNSLDEMEHDTTVNMENITSTSKGDETSKSEFTDTIINYDLISQDSRGSTVSAKKAALLAKLNVPLCPKLSGNPDVMIDLESGTLQPKESGLSGVDILFHRLAKCSAPKVTSSIKPLSILSIDDGVVKFNTVSLFSDEERPVTQKDPTPGAAFIALKKALKEKIDNNRRESIRKREAEFIKKQEIEKAANGNESDNEEEELTEDDCSESETEQNEENCAAGQLDRFLNVEAIQKENSEDENVMEDEYLERSDSSASEEETELEIDKREKKKGRIIKAFEDSDDDVILENDNPSENPEDTKLLDVHIFTDQNQSIKPNSSNENNEENNIPIWKADASDSHEEMKDDDLMALCSGRFDTQLEGQNSRTEMQNTLTRNQCNGDPLYTQGEDLLGDSQLMNLCSGNFETQSELNEREDTNLTDGAKTKHCDEAIGLEESDGGLGGRLRLDSSDDETEPGDKNTKAKCKNRKRKLLSVSDDENDNDSNAKSNDEEEDSDIEENLEKNEVSEDEPENENERYVDYDSEENEVEITLTKKEKQRIGAKFVENEAELSESDWGSADEDEKGLDRYDIEVGDEEQYDQKQLQQELEKIHNRQMLDRDHRELEQLKEIFLEDEENDGFGRERQFRWKNVEKTFSLDYDKRTNDANLTENNGEGSDEETELQWRKMRHERNLLLKEKNVDLNAADLTATTLLNPMEPTCMSEGPENNTSSINNTSLTGKKKITIVKKTNTTTSAAKKENPFLIPSPSVVQSHKASFLSRDQETLNRLANLVKSNPETEGSNTVLAAKARNFVFTTLSPAVQKVSSKRSLDPENDEENSNTKKAKTSKKESNSSRKLMLDTLV